MNARISELLFRLALRAYPREFRRRFAEPMLETLLERLAERRIGGRTAALRYGLRAWANLVSTGIRERFRPSLGKRPRAPRRFRRCSVKGWVTSAAREVRFAVRSFRKAPGFTILAVSTLALGVGANTAIFSVVDGVLLEPLPYPDPEGLVFVRSLWSGPQPGEGSLSYPDLIDIETEAPSIASLVGYSVTGMTLTGVGEPVVLDVVRVTKGLLETFQLAPVLGRDVRADEFGPEGPRVVVVGHSFWHSRLGARPDVLGDILVLNAISHEIVGVAPEGFDFPTGAELWIPLRLDLEGCGRGCHSLLGVGRLARGASLEEARAELDAIGSRFRAAYPDTNTNKAFLARSLRDSVVGDVRPRLLLLLGAVALVLLIACVNVANLMLVRASTRSGEVAIRTALGASRAHLLAQTLVESSILALAGGALGIAIAWGGLTLLPGIATGIPRVDTIALDRDVLLFTLGSLVLVTLLFGAAPAFALVRGTIRSSLWGSAAGSGQSHGHQRFRSALLAVETALAALLLVGAGLLSKSFVALYSVEVGFEPRNVSRFSLILPEVRYDSIEEIRAFYRSLEDRLRAVPGVESVGSVWGPPLGRGRATGKVLVTGRPDPPPGEEREASIHSVGPGFLETMRIPVLRGRGLTAEDDAGPVAVAVVNETFVRENFPGKDPLGREVEITVDLGYGSPKYQIVGVVGDVRSRAIEAEPEPQIYVPHGIFGPENLTVTVRSRPEAAVVPAAREILREMDPDVPMHRIETMAEAVERQFAPARFHLVLALVFASIASVLAAVGIYGVVAYVASRRTREIGLRFALGASKGSVTRLVLQQGLAPSVAGLALGLVAAHLGARVMEAVLFGVEPRDPSIFLGTILLVLAVALAATIVPAHRASRLDPARALRTE